MNKLVVQALGLLLMICLSLSEIQAVNIKEKSETKAQIKTNKHRYVGDPMLMQASEPSHLVHMRDQSVQLAQLTSNESHMGKMSVMSYEMDTGMVVLIVILTIIIVCCIVFCCCWCLGCCIFAAAEAERKK